MRYACDSNELDIISVLLVVVVWRYFLGWCMIL